MVCCVSGGREPPCPGRPEFQRQHARGRRTGDRPAGIPTVSPSASSPRLTTAADRDFLFRTVVSDSAQGPVLARITRERGFDNVGVIYRDDAWGTGLADAFAAAWTGEITAEPFAPEQTTFVAELRLTAGATAPDNPATDGWEAAFVAGDLERGHIGIWRFTEDERIETVDVVPWQR